MWSTLLSQNRRAFQKLHSYISYDATNLPSFSGDTIDDTTYTTVVFVIAVTASFFTGQVWSCSYHIWQKWILSHRPVHLVFGDCHAWGCTLAKGSSIDIPWKCTQPHQSVAQSSPKNHRWVRLKKKRHVGKNPGVISVASSTEEKNEKKQKKGGRDVRQGRERPHIACTRPQRVRSKIHDDFSSRRLNTRPTWGESVFITIQLGTSTNCQVWMVWNGLLLY